MSIERKIFRVLRSMERSSANAMRRAKQERHREAIFLERQEKQQRKLQLDMYHESRHSEAEAANENFHECRSYLTKDMLESCAKEFMPFNFSDLKPIYFPPQKILKKEKITSIFNILNFLKKSYFFGFLFVPFVKYFAFKNLKNIRETNNLIRKNEIEIDNYNLRYREEFESVQSLEEKYYELDGKLFVFMLKKRYKS